MCVMAINRQQANIILIMGGVSAALIQPLPAGGTPYLQECLTVIVLSPMAFWTSTLLQLLEATTTVEITVHVQKVKGIAIVIPNVRVALHVSMM